MRNLASSTQFKLGVLATFIAGRDYRYRGPDIIGPRKKPCLDSVRISITKVVCLRLIRRLNVETVNAIVELGNGGDCDRSRTDLSLAVKRT